LLQAISLAMAAEKQHELTMIERIERALVLLAYFIELDGDVHVPMYEKFEAELEELKKKEDTKARAQRRLLDYAISRHTRPFHQGDADIGVVIGASYSEAPPISTKSGALKAIR
jgi:hypothetical protein